MKLIILIFVLFEALEVFGHRESPQNYKYKFDANKIISNNEAQLKLATGFNNSKVSYEVVKNPDESQFSYSRKLLEEDLTTKKNKKNINYWLCEFQNLKNDKSSEKKEMKTSHLINLKLKAIEHINESIESINAYVLKRMNPKGELVNKYQNENKGKCLYYLTAYWAYEVCLDDEIEQFHIVEIRETKEMIVDPHVNPFILGNFKGKKVTDYELAFEDDIGNYQVLKNGEGKDNDESGLKFNDNDINRWSIVQTISNGQSCDLTGAPRKINVKYSCFSDDEDMMIYIEKTIDKLVNEVYLAHKEMLIKLERDSETKSRYFTPEIYGDGFSVEEYTYKHNIKSSIADIKEWKTCRYDILVNVPKLCEIPEFVSKRNNKGVMLDNSKITGTDVLIECVGVGFKDKHTEIMDEKEIIDNSFIDINEYKLFDVGLGFFFGIYEENIYNLGRINISSGNYKEMEFKPDVIVINDFGMMNDDIDKIEIVMHYVKYININILEFNDNLKKSMNNHTFLFTKDILSPIFDSDGAHYCLKIYNKLGEYLNTFVLHRKVKKIWFEISTDADYEKNFYRNDEFVLMEAAKADIDNTEEEKESTIDITLQNDDSAKNMLSEAVKITIMNTQEEQETTTHKEVAHTGFVRDEL